MRHEAAKFGLTPDENGWVGVDPFVDAIKGNFADFQDLTIDDLLDVVLAPDNPRHEIRDDRIRAVYGHSKSVGVDYPVETPPAELFHGTSAADVGVILQDGLKAMTRGNVHLSEDIDRAQRVGRRKGKEVVVLTVDAVNAARDGIEFHNPVEGIWLVRHIPATFIRTSV